VKKILPWVALAFLAGAGGFTLYHYLAQRTPEQAPDLTLTRLEGGELKLADLRGKLVLVNFWATWCAPCMAEVPLLVEMQQRYGARGLQILGPALDDAEQVRLMLPRLRIQYPVLIGEDSVTDAMTRLGEKLGALPYSVLIAPNGTILLQKHGEFQRQELIELMERHLPRA
jgi:thiol-disulfide isomerase/thioredoxin